MPERENSNKGAAMHFLGLAVGPKNTDEVDAQLEQWSEYTEVEPYVTIPNEDVLTSSPA